MIKTVNEYIYNKKIHASTLAFFRVTFGVLMFFSVIRFWSKGWIDFLYIKPDFHFKYFGFEWVQDLGIFTYVLFILCIISSFFVTIGYKYRISIISFFLVFTYVELIDKTTYLNHYYLTSCLSFIMCFLPAGNYFSVDNLISGKKSENIPAWSVDSIKFFICLVYFFAGIAKINSDWLIDAQPLSIWLKSKYDIPIIGQTLLQQKSIHYIASWFGMIYDVFIPFLLIYARTKYIAFFLVILFHVLTKVFFPAIGMFPYIMIFSAVIFFDSKIHIYLLKKIKIFLYRITIIFGIKISKTNQIINKPIFFNKFIPLCLSIFLFLQIIFPFRYFLYPGELFWNEQGYRFSWRVMLIEKRGNTTFKIKDSITKKIFYVKNDDFLTPFQIKQMSFQPDFILEYAHYLGDHFKKQGHKNIQIFTDSFVALNGRPSQRFIDPNVDLLSKKESFYNKDWVLPLNDDIKGL
tara:strand:+ start:404 stop:1789 length:1386 start_codon:yes stop_codon:yes gene_type:complete